MKFSKIRNIFHIFKKTINLFKKLNYLKIIRFLKISKNENFKNQIDFFLKSKFSIKKSQKWPSVKKLTPDRNLSFIVIWCSYSAEIKLQYMKNTFHVAHFHINMVFLTRNMFKEIKVPKSRGALGTGFTYAPVLLFELYLAINNSSTSHSSRRKNTSTLRVTLREGRILLLYGSLCFKPAVNRQPGFRRWDS